MGHACAPARLRALAVYVLQQHFVPSGRARELLADLTGASVSLGTLLSWVQQSAATLAPVEARLTAALRQAPVLHSDETGVRRGGRLAWAHVGRMASTARLPHYAVHATRGMLATDAMGILSAFTGVSVHDIRHARGNTAGSPLAAPPVVVTRSAPFSTCGS
jgi:transposase